MLVFLLSALTLGLGSSLHCMGMCGPLVMAMPFQDSNGEVAISRLVLYHLGKTLSYASLGFILGSFGMGFKLIGYQQSFSIFFGAFILLITIAPYIFKEVIRYQNGLLLRISNVTSTFMSRLSPNSIFYLGVANGLIPCGIVYIALAASVLLYSSWKASLFMMVFGIGTIPSLTVIIYSKKLISGNWGNKFKKLTLILSVTLSFLFMLRGMNLGIPYLSPKLDDKSTLNCCHKK